MKVQVHLHYSHGYFYKPWVTTSYENSHTLNELQHTHNHTPSVCLHLSHVMVNYHETIKLVPVTFKLKMCQLWISLLRFHLNVRDFKILIFTCNVEFMLDMNTPLQHNSQSRWPHSSLALPGTIPPFHFHWKMSHRLTALFTKPLASWFPGFAWYCSTILSFHRKMSHWVWMGAASRNDLQRPFCMAAGKTAALWIVLLVPHWTNLDYPAEFPVQLMATFPQGGPSSLVEFYRRKIYVGLLCNTGNSDKKYGSTHEDALVTVQGSKPKFNPSGG